MGDLFDTYMHISNSHDIRENQLQVSSLQKLQELEQRATVIERRYGVEVPRYYEYKEQNPVPQATLDPTLLAGFTVGGAALGGLFSPDMRVGGAIIGGVSGAIMGVIASDRQAYLDAQHVNDYGQFLISMENVLKQQSQIPQATLPEGAIRDGMVTLAAQRGLQ